MKFSRSVERCCDVMNRKGLKWRYGDESHLLSSTWFRQRAWLREREFCRYDIERTYNCERLVL